MVPHWCPSFLDRNLTKGSRCMPRVSKIRIPFQARRSSWWVVENQQLILLLLQPKLPNALPCYSAKLIGLFHVICLTLYHSNGERTRALVTQLCQRTMMSVLLAR